MSPRRLTGIIHGMVASGLRISGRMAWSRSLRRKLFTLIFCDRHFSRSALVSSSEKRCQATEFSPGGAFGIQSRRSAHSGLFRRQSLQSGPNILRLEFRVFGSESSRTPLFLKTRAKPPIPSHSQCETNCHSTSLEPDGMRP